MLTFPQQRAESELFGEPGRLTLLSQAAHIVIIDDEPSNVELVTQIMLRGGFQSITGLTDPRELRRVLQEAPPDLVITDLHMPGIDGFGVLDMLGERIAGEHLPVLIMTGDGSPAMRQRALEHGAKDFVTKPFDIAEITLRVRNLLETRVLFQDLRKQNRTLLEWSNGQSRELESTRVEMIERLAIAAEYRDDDTNQHNLRVGDLSAKIAEAIGFTPEDVGLLRRAAALHDIGKIGIPDALLHKPGSLTEGEFRVVRTHTTIGARIVGGSQIPLLRLAETIALSHHERWDGTGYPRGLKGDGIPLPGRIVAVADAFDAMTSDRPYRKARSANEAIAQLKQESGRQFEVRLADALEEILNVPVGPPGPRLVAA